MSSRAQRRMLMKNWHISATVIGLFLMFLGLYMAIVVSAGTNRKNAECTEKTVGTITEVTKSGSSYATTIDYTIEDYDKTITVQAKKDLGVGNTIDVFYEPMSWSHLYIEGITSTGKNDVIFGLLSALVGGGFFVSGIMAWRNKKRLAEK